MEGILNCLDKINVWINLSSNILENQNLIKKVPASLRDGFDDAVSIIGKYFEWQILKKVFCREGLL